MHCDTLKQDNDSTVRGMGEVGSARYEPALLPPCPSIRVLSYSNYQEIHSRHRRAWQCKCKGDLTEACWNGLSPESNAVHLVLSASAFTLIITLARAIKCQVINTNLVSRWLWPGNRTFLAVASMVVTWQLVAFCVVKVLLSNSMDVNLPSVPWASADSCYDTIYFN